jgi:hypothetical protein
VPEYDNLLLSHADRTRVIVDDDRARIFTKGAFLIDGFVAGTWTIGRSRDASDLLVETFRRLHKEEQNEAAEEGARLLAFFAPEISRNKLRFNVAK